MDLLQLFVVQCVLMVANAVTTISPNLSTESNAQNEVSSPKPPDQEYISRCHSNEDIGGRFVLQREFASWFEALAACAAQGLQLAVPRSPQEAAALGAKLFHVSDPAPSADAMLDALLVGVHDIDEDDRWRTLDGSLLSEAGFDLWLDGGLGQCGALLGDGRYVRQPCHSRMRFACERPRGAAPARQRRAQGYVEVGDAGRFRLYEEPLAWALALQRCEAEGATLAVPASAREAGLLAGVLFTRAAANARLHRLGFFVGVTDVAQEGQWRTVAGDSLDATGYATWKIGEPSGRRQENCGVLLRDGRYADHSCTAPMAYCCQENVAPRVSEDLVITRGQYRLHQKPLPWFEALQACLRENATLASPDTQEIQFVKDLMCSGQYNPYGNCVAKFPSIHVAIYDLFGNQTWKNVNEGNSRKTRSFVQYSMRSGRNDPESYNEFESRDVSDSTDFDNSPEREGISVSYTHTGEKCVKMVYNGKFENQRCSGNLPYVCKRIQKRINL